MHQNMQPQQKNYIGFTDDHSTSMQEHVKAAINDSNANIMAIKDATNREMQDVIVYRNRFGTDVTREVINSNPHVLQPTKDWTADGWTALYDGIGDMITQLQAVPDFRNPNVSFLVIATTDGDENKSKVWNATTLGAKIRELQKTERWTFVLRVPKGERNNPKIKALGIPDGNIQEWDTTSAEGLKQATVQTTQAMDNFITQRSKGIRGSSSFYVNDKAVNVAQLEEVTSDYKLYCSGDHHNDTDGMMISSFIMNRRTKYLKGAAFFQLVKTESKVGPEKIILIQERTTGKIYTGPKVREMLGIPRGQNARITPTDLAGYNIFIQSTSWNRKIGKGTGVVYNDKLGVEFTQEEIDRFTLPAAPKVVPQAPLSASLPTVSNPVGRNIKSGMPVTQAQPVFYKTRDDARRDKQNHGADYADMGSDQPKGKRFLQTKRPNR